MAREEMWDEDGAVNPNARGTAGWGKTRPEGSLPVERYRTGNGNSAHGHVTSDRGTTGQVRQGVASSTPAH